MSLYGDNTHTQMRRKYTIMKNNITAFNTINPAEI